MNKRLSESRYTKFNRDGFRIMQIYEIWGTYYVIAQNGIGDYVWGKDYDLERGYWNEGVYKGAVADLKPEIYGKLVMDNAGWGYLK